MANKIYEKGIKTQTNVTVVADNPKMGSRVIKLCSVEGCIKEHDARGFCKAHYARYVRNGDPLGGKHFHLPCSISECDNVAKARNLCGVHYIRERVHGDPVMFYGFKTTEERFWANVDKSGSCWLWTGSLNGSGYGKFGVGGSQVRAHRWVMGAKNGDPDILHSCDNPPCVNPSHLRFGSHQENMREAFERGRFNAYWARKLAKTHCVHGHEYTPGNTRVQTNSGKPARSCKECHRIAEANRRQKEKI